MAVLGITHLHASHELGHRVRLAGNQHQMDVVGHEAIAEHIGWVEQRILLQESKVDLAVGGGKENVAGVMRALWDDDSGKSWHITISAPSEDSSQEI
jgi:FlaG/FlaF family flagellin (archaellin)